MYPYSITHEACHSDDTAVFLPLLLLQTLEAGEVFKQRLSGGSKDVISAGVVLWRQRIRRLSALMRAGRVEVQVSQQAWRSRVCGFTVLAEYVVIDITNYGIGGIH